MFLASLHVGFGLLYVTSVGRNAHFGAVYGMCCVVVLKQKYE